jgi:hypothetical protein
MSLGQNALNLTRKMSQLRINCRELAQAWF